MFVLEAPSPVIAPRSATAKSGSGTRRKARLPTQRAEGGAHSCGTNPDVPDARLSDRSLHALSVETDVGDRPDLAVVLSWFPPFARLKCPSRWARRFRAVRETRLVRHQSRAPAQRRWTVRGAPVKLFGREAQLFSSGTSRWSRARSASAGSDLTSRGASCGATTC